jgi:hypothetical protein
MDEIDQSDNSDQNQNSEPQIKDKSVKNQTNCQCLADTQKLSKFEKIVNESKGSYYFYQLDDDTNTYLDPL